MRDVTPEPLPQLAPRLADSHKGDYGRAMIVGGSRGMAGAVAMAGMACLRSGAGLVTLGVPRCIGATVASFCPAYMVRELTDDEPGVLYWANCFDLEPVQDQFDVWAIGPGLGHPELTCELSGRMNRTWTRPLVIDADGLNGLTLFDERYGDRYEPMTDGPPGPRILTPHPGEFARLASGLLGDEELAAKGHGDEAERIEAAGQLAARDPSGQTVVVLKGNRTIVSDGRQYAVNATGNPGMATGGSGDVLTGVITALAAQGLPAFEAARLGVYLHGLAGDLAAEQRGQVAMLPTDIIDCLGAAFER